LHNLRDFHSYFTNSQLTMPIPFPYR
jgi:hypothetical protein